jgi:excisionase family DNA binding protein
MDETHYLTAAEVSERLGISLRTVRRRIADGSLPSVKIGGAVRVPVAALEPPDTVRAPEPWRAAAREAAASYGTESDAAYITRWNHQHWPDTYERMLERRRRAFAKLEEVRRTTRPPSGPHDTVDAILDQVREEFGRRLLPFIPERAEPHE